MPAQPDLIARGLGATDAELGLAEAVVFHVYIRGADFSRLGELTDWISFSFTSKFNDVGTWALETSSDSLEANLLAKRGGIIVTREIGGVETTIFSGPVATEWGYTGKTFRAAGYCDNFWLLEPARPNPELAGPPFTADYHVLTGQASVVMRLLVADNIGPLAPVAARLAPIGFPIDPLLGSTITSRANLQPLLTLLAELAITPYAGGLGFYLRQSDVQAALLEFIVYAPPDRSADAKFSLDLGTIQDYEDMAEAPAGNRVYVMGGDGFGADRTIIYVEDADSIAEWGQMPAITIDQRGTTDTSELEQKAAEAIAGVATLRRTSVKPFDVPSLQYGSDYDLGSLVSVITSSGEVVDLIRQVQIDLDPEKGPVITPVVGQGDGSDEERLATIVRTIQDRTSNLERNWNIPPDSVDRSMLVPVQKPPIGKIEWLAGSAVPDGYLAANGQAVSRTTYSLLFAAIGTTWGAGDGSTTFNVPELRNRSPIGSGLSYSLGQLVGAATQNIEHSHTGAAHTHPGSHSHGQNNHTHPGAPHTHPGSHSHGLNNHTHGPGSHQHNTDIDHDHGAFNTGLTAFTTDVFGRDAAGATGTGHRHQADPPALGTSVQTSSVPSNSPTDAATGNTADDSTAPAASFSGSTGTPTPTTTEADSNAPAASYTGSTGLSGSTSLSIVHPSAGLLPVIYSGV